MFLVYLTFSISFSVCRGWSGGAKVLGKLPEPGRPTNLDNSRAGAYCTCSRCGWGLFLDIFSLIFSLIYHFSFLSPSLWETARYRLKYCLKGPLSPKQPTNQISVCQAWHCFELAGWSSLQLKHFAGRLQSVSSAECLG